MTSATVEPGTAQAQASTGQIVAWGLWDWGASGFHAVVMTFVFSVYLVEQVGKDLPGQISAATWFSWAIAAAGVIIALAAPVTGQRADAGGHRKRSVTVWTLLVVAVMYGLFFVRDDHSLFWLGCALLGLGSIFSSFSEVSYYAMIRQVSTPATIGRVSGFGWSMGYFGGIFLLLLAYFGFVAGSEGGVAGAFKIATADGLNIRLVALVAATWFLIFALPLMISVPEMPAPATRERVGIAQSYRILIADLRRLWHTDRNAVYFLVSSALFRDGLAAIFSLGAVLAASVYGLPKSEVLIFGIAANVVAALGAVAAGFLDDRLGPKRVIMGSLIGLLVSGTALLFVSGKAGFWMFGLPLTLFVGPAQSASRTFLARVAPVGHEGEMFGLYTTTGRVVSFLAPALFGVFAALGGGDRFGILGILVVLLAGLLVLLPVRKPLDKALLPVS